MSDQLSLFERRQRTIGKPEPTQEQWLTSTVKPDFSASAVLNKVVIKEEEEPFDIQALVDNFLGGFDVRGNTNIKKIVREKLEEIASDENHPIRNYLKFAVQERDSNKEKFERLKNITDKESATKFITEGLGYTQNSNGKFQSSLLSPDEETYYGTRYRGGGFRTFVPPHLMNLISDLEQETGEGNRLDQYSGIQSVQDVNNFISPHVINNISPELAEELYDMFDNPGEWDGFGRSGDNRAFFNGTANYEFDEDGNFTGTDFDRQYQLLRDTIDSAEEPESKEAAENAMRSFQQSNFKPREPGRNRGIAMLQKVLALAGVEPMTGSPDFLSPRGARGTIDHAIPVSKNKGEFDNAEAIGNMIPFNPGGNQVKGKKSNADYAKNLRDIVSGKTKTQINDPNVDEEPLSYNDLKSVSGGIGTNAGRLEDLLKDRRFLPQLEELDVPEILRGLAANEDGVISDILDQTQGKLNKMKDGKTTAAEADINDLSSMLFNRLPAALANDGPSAEGQNWAGDPFTSSGMATQNDDSLQALRKAAMLVSLRGKPLLEEYQAAVDPNNEEAAARFRNRNGLKTKEVKGHLDNVFSTSYNDPIMARMLSWMMGLSDHDEFTGELEDFRNKTLMDLEGQISDENFDKLSGMLSGENTSYRDLIAKFAEERGFPERVLRTAKGREIDDQLIMDRAFKFNKQDDGSFVINNKQPKYFQKLLQSHFSRNHLIDRGFGQQVRDNDEALNPSSTVFDAKDDGSRGALMNHNKVLTKLNPTEKGQGEFRTLLGRTMTGEDDGKVVWNPEKGKFLEDYIVDSKLVL